jgi:hypothetical protein
MVTHHCTGLRVLHLAQLEEEIEEFYLSGLCVVNSQTPDNKAIGKSGTIVRMPRD